MTECTVEKLSASGELVDYRLKRILHARRHMIVLMCAHQLHTGLVAEVLDAAKPIMPRVRPRPPLLIRQILLDVRVVLEVLLQRPVEIMHVPHHSAIDVTAEVVQDPDFTLMWG